MKGLDISISLVIALVIGVAIIVTLGLIVSGNISAIEAFGEQNLDLFAPSETE